MRLKWDGQGFRIREMAGMATNFAGYERQLTTNARRTVTRNANRMLELVHAYVAFDTGRMLRLAKIIYTPSGLGFEGGWIAQDFYNEGEPFYPPFPELGTSRMAAQPSLFPAWLEVQGRLRSDLTRDMRRSANRV